MLLYEFLDPLLLAWKLAIVDSACFRRGVQLFVHVIHFSLDFLGLHTWIHAGKREREKRVKVATGRLLLLVISATARLTDEGKEKKTKPGFRRLYLLVALLNYIRELVV